MKTIVFLRSNPVSPDSRVEKEVNSLIKNGYFVTVIGWDRGENYKAKKSTFNLQDGNAVIIRRGLKASFGEGMKNLIPFIKFQAFLFSWLIRNKNNYNIVHACDFDTGFTANMARIFTRKKLVFDLFDYLSTDANSLFRRIIKKCEDNIINKADATIICTEQRREQIKDSMPRKLVVIHNTPDLIPDVESTVHDKVRVAYVGILQDYRLILETTEVIAKYPDIELHIGGFGKLENQIIELSNKYKNIIYYGKLLYQDTLKLENSCDIMTAIYDPSIGNHYYAAPNKFYEALMLGKPLIMVKNTGMSNIVSENDIGVCIDFNKQSFEEGLLKLISRRNEWDSIKDRMNKLYNEDYSWKVMEQRLVSLYQDLYEEGM